MMFLNVWVSFDLLSFFFNLLLFFQILVIISVSAKNSVPNCEEGRVVADILGVMIVVIGSVGSHEWDKTEHITNQD